MRQAFSYDNNKLLIFSCSTKPATSSPAFYPSSFRGITFKSCGLKDISAGNTKSLKAPSMAGHSVFIFTTRATQTKYSLKQRFGKGEKHSKAFSIRPIIPKTCAVCQDCTETHFQAF